MRTTVPASTSAPSSPTRAGHPLRSVLRGADFRRLYGTRLASQCADGVFQASLAGAVLFNPERAADPAAIAAGFAVLLLPYSMVGPFAGVLLDRWRRQRVLVATNLFRCLAVALVAVEIATGTSGALFYGTALVVISVNRFFLAALSASLPHVVSRETLVTANALATTSGTVVALLGGGIALGLRELVGSSNVGYAVIALGSAAGYAGSAWAASGFGKDLLGPDDVERSHRETVGDVARGLVAGARHVAELRPVASALAAIAAHRFFYGLSTISVLLLYRNYFTDDGFFQAELAGLGQVFAASGLGVLVAAAITPAVVRRIGKAAWISAVFAVAAVTELALGLPFTMPTLLPAAFVLSVVAHGSKISVDTLVQEHVEDDYRGRVFSFYDTLFNVMFVAAAVVGATILPESGKSYGVVVLIAVGYALTAACYRLATRRI
ncbi:MAG TPA: MFS transporter [Mycobacteriales bacterium]|nr:MFS transporter [Mycobacteriales bacterium]